ncbi:hypothetical protein [Rudaea sp.]|uniref:hypothetical protein n=1 Tax=Rudaea sp. TaxID=2136325 RepID=UPI00321F8E20
MKSLNAIGFFVPALLAGAISTAVGAADVGMDASARAAQPSAMTAQLATTAAQPSAMAKARETSDGITPAQLARAQSKLAHATQIADQFAQSATEAGLPARWHTELVNALMANPESSFAQVQAKGNASDAMLAANSLGGGTVAPGVQPGVLGDVTDDLTYIPLASPCRIVDTRVAGGIVVGTIARNFVVTPSNTGQGGAGCNPWTGYLGQGLAGAVAVNITVDANGQTAVPGSYLTAFATGGTVPATSWVNFAGGQVASNGGILPLSTSPSFGFTVLTSATTHVIVDVTGSFVRPEATALDCTTTAGGTLTLNTTTRNGNTSAPSCPAGYTRVSTHHGANGDFANMYVQVAGDGYAFFYYGGSTSVSPFVYAKCCRVPGR